MRESLIFVIGWVLGVLAIAGVIVGAAGLILFIAAKVLHIVPAKYKRAGSVMLVSGMLCLIAAWLVLLLGYALVPPIYN